jgi:hypothetical protein
MESMPWKLSYFTGTLPLPILATFADSYREFLKKFLRTGTNLSHSFILNNPVISAEFGFNSTTNSNFWSAAGTSSIQKISTLRINNFFNNGNILDLFTINNSLDINIPPVTFFRLLPILKRIQSLSPNLHDTGTGLDIIRFLARFKKGSKQCRAIFTGSDTDNFQEILDNFVRVSGSPTSNLHFKDSIQLWNMYCLPNDFREFLLLFFNNRLPLKYRIANYTDSDKWCTFCSLIGNNLGPFADETFYHLFVECPSSKKLH